MDKITLNTPLRYLKGVGPERSKLLARLGLVTLEDAFYFFPRRYEDRTRILAFSELVPDARQCVRGVIQSRGFVRLKNGRTMFRAVVRDVAAGARHTVPLLATWFNQPYLNTIFKPKLETYLCGKAVKIGRFWQMLHPEFEMNSGTAHFNRIVPIYPLTEDLYQKSLRALIFRVLEDYSDLLKENLDEVLKKSQGLCDLRSAIRQIHFPENIGSRQRAYERLVFDEFFVLQLAIEAKRAFLRRENKSILHPTGRQAVGALMDSLGVPLTQGQSKAIEDILADMERPVSMHRLVQGDVGSGKTFVAAAALTFTAVNGFQGALMAPTEVLAGQHFFTLKQILEPLGITCGYLAQGMDAAEKEKTLRQVESGEIQVVVGTHSLIGEGVHFCRLGLAVIDEQHKFGVFQRAALKAKGKDTHFLLLTATPIPRTLALTVYGSLDISLISQLPKGRKPIETLWVEESRRLEIYAFAKNELLAGRQMVVVCPAIEHSLWKARASVTAHFHDFKASVLHGRMRPEEKKKIMQDFSGGQSQILVSTVVIEVGVDVPNATVLLIEGAEKFGLSQLHQLRGRVGRGPHESFCFVFSESENPETAERLRVFTTISSGFEVAEKDLALRGGGDVLGEKQHGFPELKIGDLVSDIAILERAKREAARVIREDPELKSPSLKGLKKILDRRYGLSKNKETVMG